MASEGGKMRSANTDLKRYQAQSTKVTAESVSKTRDMLHLVNECKDAGVNTLGELYDQGDQLTRTEVILNDTSEQIDSAHTRVKNIEKANNIHCCCLPCLSCFQKDPDRKRKQDSSHLSKKRDKGKGEPAVSTVLPPRDSSGVRNKDDRFFPKVLGTTEEEEIEHNLSHVSEHLTQLKGIALDMNVEVSKQNEQLDRMNDKAEKSVVKLNEATKTTTDLVNDKKSNSNNCCCCSIC